jgi:uncharacterized lipoprotein
MKQYLLLAALGASLVAGCSTNNTKTAAADDDEKVTVTGSRIPRNDRNAAGVKSTSDTNAIKDMMKPNPGGGMPGS